MEIYDIIKSLEANVGCIEKDIADGKISPESQAAKDGKAFKVAAMMLRKQIPYKPNIVKSTRGNVRRSRFCTCVCSAKVTPTLSYCNMCGQKLDWSEYSI